MTLTERLAAGRPPHKDRPPATEDDLARYRLQRWQEQLSLESGSCFEQRLALDNLTEIQLRHLLTEPVESLRKRFPQPPLWLAELDQALSRSCVSNFRSFIPTGLEQEPTAGFLNVAAPIIEQASIRFDKALAAITTSATSLPFDPATVRQILFADLHKSLLKMLSRTMVLELNIARLNGELEGNTAEERFRSFVERLSQPQNVRSLLQEYPVLARLLTEQAQRWVTVSLEFLERLCKDWADIRATFAPDHDPGVLVAVAANLSDTHRGGRSVFIAKFSSGFRLVYKPKSLAVDVHFQDFLKWFNARNPNTTFPTMTILNRETWGWVEHVSARDCQTQEEVRRFYRRQGGYLALLYLLEGTDFHAGNLIACGEYPYLIDLEALFHPHRTDTEPSDLRANDLADQVLFHSVLGSGLLPERVWGNSEHEGVDLSGLGTAHGQMTPHALPDWEEAGTDAMRLIRKRKPIEADKNRPRLAGAWVDVLDYRDEILDGFASAYSVLLENKDELLSDHGPLARFAEDEVCVFLRSARTYRRLLRESYHPDMLRDALDRDRLFDLLWVEVEDDAELARVIQGERDNLWQGDIPLFTTRSGSRDLWTSTGERLPDFFTESSWSVVQRRAMNLSHEDCSRQAWIIQASLASVAADEPQRPLPRAAIQSDSVVSAERLVSAAQAVGDRLETLALRGQGDASWIGLTLERDRCWSVTSSGLDLDGGLPGMALFLAYLGAITKQEKYTALAQAALATMQHQIKEDGASVGFIGAFDGWGGMIYVLTHLGVLWSRPDLIAEAELVVDLLPVLITEDEELNVYGGAAGCIAALRVLSQIAPARRVTAAAIQCGDHLLKQARKMPNGIGWITKSGASEPLEGFAHGTAGIAWSLLKLYEWTKLERFRVAAHEAMLYEQSLFVAEEARWPDLREHETLRDKNTRSQRFQTAWHHGTAGIGMARLDSLLHLDNPTIRAEIAAALAATLRHGFGNNHSLAHGDAGSLEFLLQTSHTLEETSLEPHVRHLTVAFLESIEQHGWRCGTPFAVETPGLLTGLAGIGYELLRLAKPEVVPSVLLFESPRLPQTGSRKDGSVEFAEKDYALGISGMRR